MQNTLSSDHFKTFDTCEHQYYLKYVQRIKLPFLTSPQIEKGKIVHALMQYSFNGLKVDHIENDLKEEYKELWNSFKSNPILNYKNILNEWEFNLSLQNTWVTGRIDAVFKNKNKYIIADWKTSLKSVDKDINYQNMIYSTAFYEIKKERLGMNPEDITFVFVSPDKNIEFGFDLEKYQNYKSILENKIIQIQNSSFDKNFKNCKFCSYKNICNSSL